MFTIVLAELYDKQKTLYSSSKKNQKTLFSIVLAEFYEKHKYKNCVFSRFEDKQAISLAKPYSLQCKISSWKSESFYPLSIIYIIF